MPYQMPEMCLKINHRSEILILLISKRVFETMKLNLINYDFPNQPLIYKYFLLVKQKHSQLVSDTHETLAQDAHSRIRISF